MNANETKHTPPMGADGKEWLHEIANPSKMIASSADPYDIYIGPDGYEWGRFVCVYGHYVRAPLGQRMFATCEHHKIVCPIAKAEA